MTTSTQEPNHKEVIDRLKASKGAPVHLVHECKKEDVPNQPSEGWELDEIMEEYNKAHTDLVLLNQVAQAQSPAVVDPIVSRFFKAKQGLDSYIHSLLTTARREEREKMRNRCVLFGCHFGIEHVDKKPLDNCMFCGEPRKPQSNWFTVTHLSSNPT